MLKDSTWEVFYVVEPEPLISSAGDAVDVGCSQQ